MFNKVVSFILNKVVNHFSFSQQASSFSLQFCGWNLIHLFCVDFLVVISTSFSIHFKSQICAAVKDAMNPKISICANCAIILSNDLISIFHGKRIYYTISLRDNRSAKCEQDTNNADNVCGEDSALTLPHCYIFFSLIIRFFRFSFLLFIHMANIFTQSRNIRNIQW